MIHKFTYYLNERISIFEPKNRPNCQSIDRLLIDSPPKNQSF